MSTTEQRLHQALSTLSPDYLTIQDDSALHAGHAGNRGGGHYTVTIVSALFNNLPLIKRHRLVHETVAELMVNDIHALSIHAKTPEEFNSTNP